MSVLSKIVVLDRLEVLEDGVIQVREKTTVMEDAVELSSSFHRWVVSPGDDVSDQDAKIQAITAAIWTPEVVAAYKAALEAK